MTAAEVDGGKASHEDAHDVKLTPLLLAKYILSVGMLIFSIILVGALMFTGNTRVSREGALEMPEKGGSKGQKRREMIVACRE